MPTYFEQRDKIIQAYFRDEIEPFDSNFCFCGTLSHNRKWHRQNILDTFFHKYQYTIREYEKMEFMLLRPFEKMGVRHHGICDVSGIPHGCRFYDGYEDALFEGMRAALDVLKEIHRSRGENVDEETPVFKKRELSTIK